jgi:S1-C subfamily serine protease
MRIATSAERKASIAPYTHTKIGAEPIQRFFMNRTALLVSGIAFPRTASPDDPSRYNVVAFASRYSTATAIDSRGYFLTTAHSIKDRAPDLVFYRDGHIEIVGSRIVWRGDASKHEPDVAILHVPRRIDSVYEWAPLPTPGPVAFIAGLHFDESGVYRLTSAAGKVTYISRPSKHAPATTTIYHEAPLQRGNSGGPLVASDGRLLGINTQIQLSIFQLRPLGLARRPDPDWIRLVIDADAQKVANKL